VVVPPPPVSAWPRTAFVCVLLRVTAFAVTVKRPSLKGPLHVKRPSPLGLSSRTEEVEDLLESAHFVRKPSSPDVIDYNSGIAFTGVAELRHRAPSSSCDGTLPCLPVVWLCVPITHSHVTCMSVCLCDCADVLNGSAVFGRRLGEATGTGRHSPAGDLITPRRSRGFIFPQKCTSDVDHVKLSRYTIVCSTHTTLSQCTCCTHEALCVRLQLPALDGGRLQRTNIGNMHDAFSKVYNIDVSLTDNG
jgi:hypothetical protein